MANQQKLDILCEKYRESLSSMTEKEKATLEADIWSALYEIEGMGVTKKVGRREEWFRNTFKGPTGGYACRNAIFNTGAAAADLLWDRIDNQKMPPRTAQRILQDAKKKVRSEKVELKKAIKLCLEEYDNMDAAVGTTSDGSIYKRKNPYSHDKKQKPETSSEFKRQIRILTSEFAELRLTDVDEYHRKKLVDSFSEWINTGVEDLLNEIIKLRANAKRERMNKIGVRRFTQSLEILGLKGTFGKPLDRTLIKKAAHKRVGPLHPDRNHGSNAKIQEYYAVIEARQLLEDYMDQLEEK